MRQWRKNILRENPTFLVCMRALLYGNSMPSLWLEVSSILHTHDAINRWLVAREQAVCSHLKKNAKI